MVEGAAGGDQVTATLVVLPDPVEGADFSSVLGSDDGLLSIVQVIGALRPCLHGVRRLSRVRRPRLR